MQGRTDDGLTANSLFPDVQKAYDKIWATGYEKRCGKIRSEETCVMTNKMTEYARGVVILDGHKSTSQVGRTPPCTIGALKIIVETLNNVGHPTRCPQHLNSVRLMMSYSGQCPHNVVLSPHCERGGPGHLCSVIVKQKNTKSRWGKMRCWR